MVPDTGISAVDRSLCRRSGASTPQICISSADETSFSETDLIPSKDFEILHRFRWVNQNFVSTMSSRALALADAAHRLSLGAGLSGEEALTVPARGRHGLSKRLGASNFTVWGRL